jgi:hypothetical protein
MNKRQKIDFQAFQSFMEGKNNFINPDDQSYENLNDYKSQVCIFPECNEIPHYNYPGRYAKYCAKHAQEQMKVHPRKTCRKPECNEFAIYSDAKHRVAAGVYCRFHKPKKGYINVIRKYCQICEKLKPALINDKCGQCVKSKQ